jgi:hypothetical protein
MSVEAAVQTAVSYLGLNEAARVTARKPRTVQCWSEADVRGDISVRCAFALDRAVLARGGAVPPIASWYHANIQLACAVAYDDARGRAERAARCAMESGQATAAHLRAFSISGCTSDLLAAERETEEAMSALGTTLFDIRRQLVAAGVERP